MIVASVLGADYTQLADEVADLDAAGVDGIQWDVMDGRFVPNLTFGPDIIAACRPLSDLPMEIHLMIEEPERYVGDYVNTGCETVIVHAESTTHLHSTIQQIRNAGAAAGVALNPSTPLSMIEHVLGDIDLLVIMTVNPGFGGQTFIESMLDKVAEARVRIDRSGYQAVIEVDGGISSATIGAARHAGAEAFISGSFVLRHPAGKQAAVVELREALSR